MAATLPCRSSLETHMPPSMDESRQSQVISLQPATDIHGKYLHRLMLGDILRLYGKDMGMFRPDHVMVAVADAQYRAEMSALHGMPLVIVSVLESVSGEAACHWGCKLMTERDESFYFVHAQKPADKKFWVQCEIVGCSTPPDPAAFSASLRQTGCRRTRVVSGQDKWSLRTGIKAVLKPSKIKDSDADPHVALAKIKASWTSRPICTSTVIRVWQRYLDCIALDDAHSFDLIKMFCPMQADKTMPTTMMRVLRETGQWQDIVLLSESRERRTRRWSGRALLFEALNLTRDDRS